MRFGDEKMYEKWSAALKMASELPETSCGGEEDSDNEDLYADLPIPGYSLSSPSSLLM
jgi:hypothetical protein